MRRFGHIFGTCKSAFSARFLLCMFVLFGLSASLFAQRRMSAIRETPSDKVLVAFVPIPLFFNSVRFDVDVKLKRDLWLSLAPEYHSKNKADLSYSGMGLQLNFRYYDPKVGRLYYAAGLGYDHTQMSGISEKGRYPEGKDYRMNVNRFGAQMQIGYLFKLWPKASLDLYFGFGYRYAIYGFPDPEKQIMIEKAKMWDYDYSGLLVQLGIRLGLFL